MLQDAERFHEWPKSWKTVERKKRQMQAAQPNIYQ